MALPFRLFNLFADTVAPVMIRLGKMRTDVSASASTIMEDTFWYSLKRLADMNRFIV